MYRHTVSTLFYYMLHTNKQISMQAVVMTDQSVFRLTFDQPVTLSALLVLFHCTV